MGREYPLNTIADLLTIPVDRLADCVEDIRLAIESAHFVAGTGGQPEWFGEFVWRDDGECRTDISFEGGECISFAMEQTPPTSDGGDDE